MYLKVYICVCDGLQPDVIVHCAAERRPDVVERHPEAAENLNVHATGALAKEAGMMSYPLPVTLPPVI